MQKEYSRTNIFIMDKSIWKWAKFQADELGKTSVSEYLFDLIKKDKDPLTESVTLSQIEYDACYNVLGMDNGVKHHLVTSLMVQDWIEDHQEDYLKVGESKDDSQ